MFVNLLKYGGVVHGINPVALKMNSRAVVMLEQRNATVLIHLHDDSVIHVEHSNEDDARRLMGLFE